MISLMHQAGAQTPEFEKKLQATNIASPAWFSESIATSGNFAHVAARRDNAVHVFRRDPGEPSGWSEAKKIPTISTHPFGSFGGGFGEAIAAERDLLVVGSPGEGSQNLQGSIGSESGSVYVFARDTGGPEAWGEMAKLLPSNPASSKRFGFAVAISGNTIIASQANEVHIFERIEDTNTWGESKILTGSAVNASRSYGASLAIHGDRLAVSDPQFETASSPPGVVYLYERNHGGPGNWGEVARLSSPIGENNDGFGRSISIDGERLVIGSPRDSGQTSGKPGAAYLFERGSAEPPTWTRTKKWVLGGEPAYDNFGSQVAVQGDRIIITARFGTGPSLNQGNAFVYERNEGGPDNWGRIASLTPPDQATAARSYGAALAMNGEIAIVGDPTNFGTYKDQTGNLGAAYAFRIPLLIPQVVSQSTDARISAGFPVQLEVSAAGEGILQYQWEKNGQLLPDQLTARFSLSSASPDDTGVYRVRISNSSGETWSDPIDLIVSADPPEITDNPGNLSLYSGQEIHLAANAKGSLPLTYQWLHNGDPVTSADGPELNIPAALSQNAGGYVLRVSNAFGSVDSSTALVEVTDQPPRFPRPHQTAYLSSEGTALLRYSVTGSLPMFFKWQRDGNDIPEATSATLEVTEPGRFSLIASNAFGENQALVFTVLPTVPVPEFIDRRVPETPTDDYLGNSIDLDGTTLIAGAQLSGPGSPPQGAAYIFEYFDDTAGRRLDLVKRLRPLSPADGGIFGASVGISNDTIIVNAPLANLSQSLGGPSYTYVRDLGGTNAWSNGIGLLPKDEKTVGNFVIQDNLMIFSRKLQGTPGGVGPGVIEVYSRTHDRRPWAHRQTIRPDIGGRGLAEAYFLALDGDTLVAGAPFDGGIGFTNGPGAVYVFRTDSLRNPSFFQTATLRQSNPVITDDLNSSSEEFGAAVAISGDTVVVGTGINGRVENSDSAFIFKRNASGQWSEVKALLPDDVNSPHGFGATVDIDGHFLSVGAREQDNSRGRVHVYHQNLGGSDNWGRVAVVTPGGGTANQEFGSDSSLSGGLLAVGAPNDDFRGSVQLFLLENPPEIRELPPIEENADGSPLRVSFAETFYDPDIARGDSLTYSIESNSAPEIFTSLSISPMTGIFSAEFAPYVSGISTVKVRATDRSGAWEEVAFQLVLPEIPAPELQVQGDPVLNRQTGLYEQQVIITNVAARAIGGIRLSAIGLPSGFSIRQGDSKLASGTAGWTLNRPIAAGEAVIFTIEYFNPRREAPSNLLYEVAATLPKTEDVPSGESFQIERIIQLPDQSVLLEFPSTVGISYQPQYSDDGMEWRNAGNPVIASSNRTQWIDQGPPRTTVHPRNTSGRLYRVIELAGPSEAGTEAK